MKKHSLKMTMLILTASIFMCMLPNQTVMAAKSTMKYSNVGSTHTIKKGEKKTLKVKTTKVSKKKQKKIKYKTSNKKVVTVSSKGKIKGKKKGKATITAYIPRTKLKATVKVTVGTKVSSLERTKFPKKKTLYVGKQYQASVTALPTSASNKKITWTSSNPSVASVNKNGLITAVDNGSKSAKATITATTNDGTKKKLTCVVTVKRYVTNIWMANDAQFNKTDNTYEMVAGDKASIRIEVVPTNATSKTVVYSGKNIVLDDNVQGSKDVLRVCTKKCSYGAKGTVIALKSGTVTLKVTAKYGGVSTSMKFRVYKPITETATNIIAHRGISNNYYENTIGAFKAAAGEPDIYGVETDIYDTLAPDTTVEDVEVPVFTPEDVEEMIEKGVITFPETQEEGQKNYGIVKKDDKVLYTLCLGEEAEQMPYEDFESLSSGDKAQLVWQYTLKDVDTYKASGENFTEQNYVDCIKELQSQWKAAVEEEGDEWDDARLATQTVKVPRTVMKTDLMVMHNSTTGEYCNVKVSIKNVTRYNRQNYPLVKPRNGNLPDAESGLIPTFDEYLANCGDKEPVIEIKDSTISDEARNRIFETIKDYGIKRDSAGMKHVIFISFSPEAVSNLSMFEPSAEMLYGVSYETMYLISKSRNSDIDAAIDFCDAYGVDAIGMEYTLCNESVVKQIHDAGYKIGIWYGAYSKNDNRLNAAKYASYGVNYVTTGVHPRDLK